MIQRRTFRFPLVLALVALAGASLGVGRSLYGEDRNSNAARTKAEIERKSREIKKTVALTSARCASG
jgi:hypothetical protein